MTSFLKTELQLSPGGRDDAEPGSSPLVSGPSPLVCCVLQALDIQGQLQHKVKLFSETSQTPLYIQQKLL